MRLKRDKGRRRRRRGYKLRLMLMEREEAVEEVHPVVREHR
jgi:hypothetical protein